ncbi:hypothetical protein DSECCO2_652550 [anaerobic digester metagenome]
MAGEIDEVILIEREKGAGNGRTAAGESVPFILPISKDPYFVGGIYSQSLGISLVRKGCGLYCDAPEIAQDIGIAQSGDIRGVKSVGKIARAKFVRHGLRIDIAGDDPL